MKVATEKRLEEVMDLAECVKLAKRVPGRGSSVCQGRRRKQDCHVGGHGRKPEGHSGVGRWMGCDASFIVWLLLQSSVWSQETGLGVPLLLLLSSLHPLPRQAGTCPPLTSSIAQLQSKPHAALAWIPQWVPFSPYAGLLSERPGEVRVRDKQVWKSGGQ